MPSFYPYASIASHAVEQARDLEDRELEATGEERDIEEVPYYDDDAEWGDIDWDDYDFDDVYDDVGDEDEDQYGEDAG